MGADVFADVHVRNVDGEDFEGGADIQTTLKHNLGDGIRALEHELVGIGGTDGGHDALTDPGDDGLLFGTTDKAVEVGAHGHPGANLDLNAVLGNSVNGAAAGGGVGTVDDLGIDRSAHGFHHALARAFGCKVDCAGAVPVEHDAGLLGGDEGLDGGDHVAAGEEVGLDVVDGEGDAGLGGGDARVDHHAVGHLAQAHGDEVGEADVGTGQPGTKPDAKEGDDDAKDDEADDGEHDKDDGGCVNHGCIGW